MVSASEKTASGQSPRSPVSHPSLLGVPPDPPAIGSGMLVPYGNPYWSSPPKLVPLQLAFSEAVMSFSNSCPADRYILPIASYMTASVQIPTVGGQKLQGAGHTGLRIDPLGMFSWTGCPMPLFQ